MNLVSMFKMYSVPVITIIFLGLFFVLPGSIFEIGSSNWKNIKVSLDTSDGYNLILDIVPRTQDYSSNYDSKAMAFLTYNVYVDNELLHTKTLSVTQKEIIERIPLELNYGKHTILTQVGYSKFYSNVNSYGIAVYESCNLELNQSVVDSRLISFNGESEATSTFRENIFGCSAIYDLDSNNICKVGYETLGSSYGSMRGVHPVIDPIESCISGNVKYDYLSKMNYAYKFTDTQNVYVYTNNTVESVIQPIHVESFGERIALWFAGVVNWVVLSVSG